MGRTDKQKMLAARLKLTCNICDSFQRLAVIPPHASVAAAFLLPSHTQCRTATNKHYDPKWRHHRWKKTFRFTLPDYDKLRREQNMDPADMRKNMKKQGFLPPRSFQERQIVIASTNNVFEEYVPPEGDGIASTISTERAKQQLEGVGKKGKSYLQTRKIRQYEEDFDTSEFADTAAELYVKAHELLNDVDNNEDDLHGYVTEKAFPEMVHMLKNKTFRWRFIQSLEAPRVVHVRTTEMMNKNNLYGQVTVRLHTQQTLAMYDRFGRLMYGSETVPKDTLEYVVFEKHLSDEYGRWRLHAKIVPEWAPAPQPLLRTMRKPRFKPIKMDPEEGSDSEKKVVPSDEGGQG